MPENKRREFEYGAFPTQVRDKGLVSPVNLPGPLGILNPVVSAITDRIPAPGPAETITDSRGRQEALNIRANAEQLREIANRDMLRGQDAGQSVQTYLQSLAQRTSPDYAGRVLQELQNYSPSLARDVGQTTPSLREQYLQRLQAGMGGAGAPAAPQAPGAPQGTGQTPATQQLNSNTPGQQRGAAIPGQRGPESMAAQRPGSGVGTQPQAAAPVQNPNRAFEQYRTGMERDISQAGAQQQQAVVQQGQAQNQQAILQAVQAAMQAGLQVPPEWQALAEGRQVAPETTSTQLGESERRRAFDREQAQFQEPVVPVLGDQGNIYARRSDAVGQQIGSAAEVSSVDRVQKRKLADEQEQFRRLNALLDQTEELINQQELSPAGVTGDIRGFMQRAGGMASEWLGNAGQGDLDPSARKILEQAKQADPTRAADSFNQLKTAMSFNLARLMDPGGRLSDQDVKRAEDMLGFDNKVQDIEGLRAAMRTTRAIASAMAARDGIQPQAQGGAPQSGPPPERIFRDPQAAMQIRSRLEAGEISYEDARAELEKLRKVEQEQRERSQPNAGR